MKKLMTFLSVAALLMASSAAIAAPPVTTGSCYDALGHRVACEPRYEGRSQASSDDIDPLWFGGGLLLLGGGIAAAIAGTNGGGNNNNSIPFIPPLPASP